MIILLRFIAFLFFVSFLNPSLACFDTTPHYRGLAQPSTPDLPLNDFLSGRIGIISPRYHLPHLIIAYRYLTNTPLSLDEQKETLMGWKEFYNSPYEINPIDANDSPKKISSPSDYTPPHYDSNIVNWVKATNRALNLESTDAAAIQQLYTTCHHYPDSSGPGLNKFKFAIERLQMLIHDLNSSKMSAENIQLILKPWIAAQQKLLVMKDNEGNVTRELISQISTDKSPLLKLDVQYMLAASYLYSSLKSDILKAADLFNELAKNTQYPWHELADYLHYRALAIADNSPTENLEKEEVVKPSTLLQTALDGMQILSLNAKDINIKKAASDYVGIIKTRLNRSGRLNELINQSQFNITQQSISDMTYLNKITTFKHDSDITVWLNYYISADSKEAFKVAYQHWEKSPTNFAWVLIALKNIQAGNFTQQEQLVQAAESITPEHAGFFTIRAALLNALFLIKPHDQKWVEHQRRLTDSALAAARPGEDFSTTLYFLKWGILLSDNIDSLLSYGFFVPSTQLLSIYKSHQNTLPHYYSPALLSYVLKQLPLSVLIQVAKSNKLPESARPHLYATLWTRAMLLNNFSFANALSGEVITYNPALRNVLPSIHNAKTKAERLSLFVKAIAQYPDLNPILYIKNTWSPLVTYPNDEFYVIEPKGEKSFHSRPYWCSFKDDEYFNELLDEEDEPIPKDMPVFSFLNPEQSAELVREKSEKNKQLPSSQWLAEITTQLAKEHPNDIRYAELLAFAVIATGTQSCYPTGSNASKRAFVLLHKLFPNTTWAKQTKYYY